MFSLPFCVREADKRPLSADTRYCVNFKVINEILYSLKKKKAARREKYFLRAGDFLAWRKVAKQEAAGFSV